MSGIRDMQLATRHVGKSPGEAIVEDDSADSVDANKRALEIRRLSQELNKAVTEERYEDASMIQKRLRELGGGK